MNFLRWLLFVPTALLGGFLIGGLIQALFLALGGDSWESGSALAHIFPFLSGLAYSLVVLFIVSVIAPSHKGLVLLVLSVFLIGDLAFAHFILPGLIDISPGTSASDDGIGLILNALRANDYANLRYGSVAKIAGALTGCFFMWRHYIGESK